MDLSTTSQTQNAYYYYQFLKHFRTLLYENYAIALDHEQLVYLNGILQQFLSVSMLQKILQAPDKQLGIAGTIGALSASIFLSPKQHMLKGPIVIALSVGAFLFAKSRWVQSAPDEWMLVIRDGKLLRGGIGMKTFIGMTDTVVRFPSRLEKVYFTANNVTKEMQGVQIQGVAFWSVYRQEDGPFRCYKYMEGNNANESVQVMCESILRNLIANSTLDDVLRNRGYLRDKIKAQLKDPFRGWGIWLQTIQITNVQISSTRLFTDMQAEFRQSAHLKAEQIELMNKEKISQTKQESDIKIATLTQSIKTKKQETKNKHMLKRKQMEAEFEKKKNQFELKKMDRQKKIELERYRNDHEINEERLGNTQKLDKMRQQFEKEYEKKAFEVDKYHDDTTLTKYEIDSVERMYSGLRSNTISINQYSGGDKDTIAALLPSIGYGMSQMHS